MMVTASAPVHHTKTMRSRAQCKINGQHWEIVPEIASLLEAILKSTGEIIKQSPFRLVTKHHIANRVFYVKQCSYHTDVFSPLKYFFKRPSSRNEWELAPRLEDLGITVVPHLAHTECWSWRGLLRSTLVTEGRTGFVPLIALADREQTQRALGTFLKQMHDRFVNHSDLNASNLLCSTETGALCLVDLDNIEISSHLTAQQRIGNLATLQQQMPLSPCFYEAYDCQLPDLARKVVECSQNRHRQSIPRKLQLLFHHRVAYAPKNIGPLKWYVRLSSWNEQLEKMLQDPDEFLARNSRLLKDGTRSTVGCAEGFVLKRFNFKKVSTVLFDLFRPSRGKRGFRTARHLELLKIATPLAIAFADRRKFAFITRSYFVMEEIVPAKFLWESAGDRPTLVARLAELLAKLHDEGFSHRDLKETNIVLNADNIPQLIDLDALHYVKKIPNRRAAAELARLLGGFSRRMRISPRERLRFLKSYCNRRQMADWRWWWDQIEKNRATKSK